MKKPKAAFIDLDGTLLDKGLWHHCVIGKKNTEVIQRLNSDYPIVFSTGRSASNNLIELMKKLGVKYAVCQNGSVIIDQNLKILKNIFINANTARGIIEDVVAKKAAFAINSSGQIFGGSWKTWIISLFSHLKPQRVNFEKINFDKVNKILVIDFSKKRIKALAKYIECNYPDSSVKIIGRAWAIEITDNEATKGIANSYVAEKYLNLNPSETIHIGDSMNDSSTIGKMGKVIAVKNAYKDFKAIADEIGPSKYFGGVGKILLKEFSKDNV
ncbi:HAD-IIB family hydrolase [Candidatus Mycoplasma pogonae]